ncbi:hypothetical protein O3P69_008289 [Scylla paramamosain]|uniref:Uncharacterized protein n=1 Tax=Scylla paramamosain TaxID=85552 RepID=A0AAW0SJH8_SCYPA
MYNIVNEFVGVSGDESGGGAPTRLCLIARGSSALSVIVRATDFRCFSSHESFKMLLFRACRQLQHGAVQSPHSAFLFQSQDIRSLRCGRRSRTVDIVDSLMCLRGRGVAIKLKA